ncbi:MAG: L,D-transpeptidase [Myxococcales bacterium]|nr:L,D-transpeptidase [Myxococcales bacterium]
MPPTPRSSTAAAAWLLALGLACDRDSAPGAIDPADDAAPSSAALETEPGSAPSRARTANADAEGSAGPPAETAETAESALPPALERRRANQALMVYTAPSFGTDFRGKIPRYRVFEVFEHVEGPGCGGDGWGRVGVAAYACLQRTEPVSAPAVPLPEVLPDGLAPFFYARLQKRGSTKTPTPAPRWRSRQAMRSGAPPEDHLAPEHDYAFVARRRFRDGRVLVAANDRVVREADVHRMRPSAFAGRDLEARPVPAGTVPAWSIMWPHAVVRDRPDPEAEVVGRLPLHAEALAPDEPPTAPATRDARWHPVSEPVEGWVEAEQLRWWVPLPPPEGVADDQVWLDVDLGQQMLALRRGAAIEFVTLVSSGNWKHGTPTGLFRLESKWAYADMRSRPDDSEEAYYVEGVPWVLYFRGRYALHGTFWHNRFGRRTSHGCINLSAHDARWVYEHTAPTAMPGWLVTYEHARAPGTLLRIRKGKAEPPDRRRPLHGR